MLPNITCNRRIFLYQISIFFCIVFGLVVVVVGIGFSANFPSNYKQNNCTDTTCLLSVFGNKCYAKFELYPDSKYELCDCRGQTLGFYNATVPCNVSEDNKPIIYCEHKIMPEIFHFILLLGTILCFILCGFCSIMSITEIYRNYSNYVNSFVLNGDKKDPPPEDKKLIELDQV